MVSKRLGLYIEEKNISYYAFENSINVSRGSISKAVKENKSIGSSALEKIITTHSDLNPTWLLTGEGEMLISDEEVISNEKHFEDTSFQNIPLFQLNGSLTLSSISPENKDEFAKDYLSIPNISKCDGAVAIISDYMYPNLKSGDIVLYQQISNSQEEIFWGEMYIIEIKIGENTYTTINYIYKSEKENYLKLVHENKRYQDKEVALDDLVFLALIKTSIRMHSIL